MKTKPNKLWIVVLALGWLFDFLFWENSPGVNFAIFWTAGLLAAFYLLLSEGLRPHRSALYLIPLFGFFAAVTFIRAEPMTTFLAYTFTMLTLTILAGTYLGGRWTQYSLADYFAKLLGLTGSMIARPIAFTTEVHKAQAEAGVKPPRYNFMPILRGLVIALPVVAIFAALLASADVVFGQRLEDFIELFKLEKLPEYIFRLIYILVIGYALAGVMLHASSESKDEKLIGIDKPVVAPFLGFIEAVIVLGSVVALFAVFVVIQFQYFFGGAANINVEGYTYSEYARRGFGELVAVAFFSLMMLFTLNVITKRETETRRRIYSGLGVALVALLLVMLVSAYQRLTLYELAYGFSRLRTYTHIFLVWIGLLLVATIALEILRRERMFAFAMLLASFGFAASLPILNADAFIVNQNIRRELNGNAVEDLDSQYFIQLSDDAIPPLVAALQTPTLPDSVHQKVAAALACIRYQRGSGNRDDSWQSFHFARLNADNALASVKDVIDEYEIVDSEWPLQAVAPSGKEYPCSQYYYD
ncbi:MAG: hypothetical protein DPW18_10495 [Chloroflexi bacterium]|nr:hypothetical protein [Chloroflexota bacterium]MDL1943919.1 DUF4173 domain-containing protein [Chloroflexi bacterium CFX2]